jgi:hypothetical protein
MKSRIPPFCGRGALAAAALLFAFAPAPRAGAQQAAVNPFTYLGRVMDASHAAFDTNRVATIYAFDAGGALLARSETFYRPDSRRNYRLRVPLADAAVKGYVEDAAKYRDDMPAMLLNAHTYVTSILANVADLETALKHLEGMSFPYVLYVLFAGSGQSDVVERYRPEAEEQLKRYPSTLDLLPESYRKVKEALLCRP